jgi:hypothetical protein
MCSDGIGLQSGMLAGAAEPSAISPARAARGIMKGWARRGTRRKKP